MKWRRVWGPLLFLLIVGPTFWLIWPPVSSPRPVTYVCSGGDRLTVTPLDTSRARLTLPDGSAPTVRQRPSAVGTAFRSPDPSLTFWTKGASAVLHRGSQPRLYGCAASTDTAGPTALATDTTWYRELPQENGWQFALRHPRNASVSRTTPAVTRLRVEGPANDPPALTDGFTVTIQIEARADTTSLAAYAAAEREQGRRVGGTVQSSLTDTTHRGRAAIVWRQSSAMGGPVTRWVLSLDDGTVASVASSVTGPHTNSYRERAEAIRGSLRFWPPNTPSDSVRAPLAVRASPEGSPGRGSGRPTNALR